MLKRFFLFTACVLLSCWNAESNLTRGGSGAGGCSNSEYCCSDIKHCLKPTKRSCTPGKDPYSFKRECATDETCCPLTKLCAKIGNICNSPCKESGSYCGPESLVCVSPTKPGILCGDAKSCSKGEICCPLTHLCVRPGAKCDTTPPFVKPKRSECSLANIPEALQTQYALEFAALDRDDDGYINPSKLAGGAGANSGMTLAVYIANMFRKYLQTSQGHSSRSFRGNSDLFAGITGKLMASVQDSSRVAKVVSKFTQEHKGRISRCEYENAMYTMLLDDDKDMFGDDDNNIFKFNPDVVIVHG